MKRKGCNWGRRLLLVMLAALLVNPHVWSKTKKDEVIVSKQLTEDERDLLPDKTIEIKMKRLSINRKTGGRMMDDLMPVLDSIAANDYTNRTFALLLTPAGNDVNIGVSNDDIISHGLNKDLYFGDLEVNGAHFVVMRNSENDAVLTRSFFRNGDIKFVQEFEFVMVKKADEPTSLIARWGPTSGLKIQQLVINLSNEPEEPAPDTDIQQPLNIPEDDAAQPTIGN